VYQNMSLTNNTSPWDFGMALLKINGNVICGFADDLDMTFNSAA